MARNPEVDAIFADGKAKLFISRDWSVYARSLTELKAKCYIGNRVKAETMYQDKLDGRTVVTGFILKDQWFTVFVPYEGEPIK